jgi:hypothetical protein
MLASMMIGRYHASTLLKELFMTEQKQGKQQVLIRVPQRLFENLFEQAARAQLDRRVKMSVPSLIVEQLEFVHALRERHPEMYDAAKAAVENIKS